MTQCTNLTWTRRACTDPARRRIVKSSILVNYTLPLWLTTAMIAAWYNCAPLSGPELLLKVARKVRTGAYYLASQDDTEGLRSLYLTGKAPIHDIDPSDGESALVVSLSDSCGKAETFQITRAKISGRRLSALIRWRLFLLLSVLALDLIRGILLVCELSLLFIFSKLVY